VASPPADQASIRPARVSPRQYPSRFHQLVGPWLASGQHVGIAPPCWLLFGFVFVAPSGPRLVWVRRSWWGHGPGGSKGQDPIPCLASGIGVTGKSVVLGK